MPFDSSVIYLTALVVVAVVAWWIGTVWGGGRGPWNGTAGRGKAARAARTATGGGPREDGAADDAQIRFFGDIAHELRTPLTVILGQLDAALVEDDQEARQHQLRMAHRQARRLERLAEQMLELTQLEAGRLQAKPRPFEAVAWLETLVMSFGELGDRKGVELDFIARPRVIPVSVDPDQLATIMTNLLSNALRYIPAGGRVGVAVDLEPVRTDGTQDFVVTVADNGPGIAVQPLDSIFERFRRGSEPDLPAGTGIGLALAKDLTELNGGTIHVDSAPGQGARFTVRLPRAGASLEGASQPTGEARPDVTEEILHRTTEAFYSGGDEQTGIGPTLLVVEDEADLLAWLSGELSGIGNVVAASGGEEGLACARADLPDIVVTDARMPGMAGTELVRRLRADERTSHIPVLMLSALTSVDDRIEGIGAGADEYVTKPVDARELRARVQGMLDRSRALRERLREQVIVKPSDVSAESVDQRFFAKVMETIEDRIHDLEFSVPDLANAMALSTSQLTRKTQALLGQSPGRLIRTVRLRRAAQLIEARTHNLSTIAYMVGFSDQSHFSRAFKQLYGVSPSAYGERAKADRASNSPPKSAQRSPPTN